MASDGKVGYVCVLAFNALTIAYAKDVTLDISVTEVDVTTRNSAGWKGYIPGHKDWTVTFDQLWVITNTGLIALRDSLLSGSILDVSILDDDGYGFEGEGFVNGLSLAQPLDDAVAFNGGIRGDGALAVVDGS